MSFDCKFDGVAHCGIRIVSDSKARTRLLRTVLKDNSKGFWMNKSSNFKVPADCGSVDIYVFIGKATKENAKAFIDNIVLKRL